MTYMTLAPRPWRIAAFCTAIGLFVSACATIPSDTELQATRDECSQFRQPFVDIARERNARIQTWASTGAAAGAGAGALIARSRGDNPLAGALIGSLIGGATGAVAGYYSDLQRRSNTTAGLRSSINSDASRDLRQADRLSSNLSSLNACRLRQIAAVESSVRQGGDRAAAQSTLHRIRTNVRLDNRIVDGVVGDLTRTRNVYVGALGQTGADTDSFVSSIQRYQPQVATPQRTALRVNTSQRPRTNNPVANLGYAEKELSAGAKAHAASVDARIDAVDALLI